MSNDSYNNITVIGLGYVGLPTAIVFASRGLRVVGVDVDVDKVKAVNEGKCYIREPGLPELLRDVVSRGLLRATTDGASAVRGSDAVVIAVPTPVKGDDVDLSYLMSALKVVRDNIHEGLLVVIESTIPPGTTVNIVKPFLEESGYRVEEDFYLAHVPERIAPGKAIEELTRASRVVGGVGPRSTEKALEIYGRVNSNLLATDATTAEFVKVIENTFRDLNIAYANLLALIAEKIGVDVFEAVRLANTHPRVKIHLPGAGVGGPCLTKDPYMLVKTGENVFGVDLIKLARSINDYMPKHVVELVEKTLESIGKSVKNNKIAILGTAYKADVDDPRESPAKTIIKELLSLGAKVVAYDPYCPETFGAERAESLEEALRDADAVVIATDHTVFRNLDLDAVKRLMKDKPVIIDGRGIIDYRKAREHGFLYCGVGVGR
ncbi:MAG: nucleotide sugar dehydrogenase [Thermosphaera sp.]